MPHSSLLHICLFVTLARVSSAVPVSPNHRFAMYTPYWQHGPHPHLPQEFIQKRPNCATDLCNDRPNPMTLQSGSEYTNSIPLIRSSKRSKNIYKTGWTMGGMPFSVLYMNPKPHISVRSPVAESLRSLPQTYDNDELLVKEAPPAAESRLDEVQVQALVSELNRPIPTMVPTRRQYSIIPQLFVSYGWGHLGK